MFMVILLDAIIIIIKLILRFLQPFNPKLRNSESTEYKELEQETLNQVGFSSMCCLILGIKMIILVCRHIKVSVYKISIKV